MLLKYRADPNTLNGLGETALQKAQQRGKRRCSELLEQRMGKRAACEGMGKRVACEGHTCAECGQRSAHGELGNDHFEGRWFCNDCWKCWQGRTTHSHSSKLQVISRKEFDVRVEEGAKWIIIDGTVIDITALTQKGDTLHKGGGDVLTRAIGDDLTGYFIYYHANIPRVDSLHKPGLSHLEHVLEKVAANAVAVLDTHMHLPPLSSPDHRFWVESDEKETYHEHSLSSLSAQGVDVKSHLVELLAGLAPGSVASRCFWAVIGCLVADAAAQPTHWNYKLSYFHEDLRKRNRWDNPEFLRPSANTYYHLPMGCQSCYGDQALEMAYALVESRGLDPSCVERRFAERFSENGDYGPLPQEGNYNGSKQKVRELPIKGPWRHISLAGFLNNLKQGHHWPNCGTDDAQADCFIRVVPVVALYAGQLELLDRVEDAVRITQNNPAAVAVGQAFARVLESIILSGSGGSEGISNAAKEFGRRPNHLEGFYRRVAGTLHECAELSGTSLYDAVLGFGGGSYSTSQVS